MRTEKGKRKTKKKRHRMLFQMGAVLLPMFILLFAAISWVVYHSVINSFLEAQNTHMEYLLDRIYRHDFKTVEGDDIYSTIDFCFDYWEKLVVPPYLIRVIQDVPHTRG